MMNILKKFYENEQLLSKITFAILISLSSFYLFSCNNNPKITSSYYSEPINEKDVSSDKNVHTGFVIQYFDYHQVLSNDALKMNTPTLEKHTDLKWSKLKQNENYINFSEFFPDTSTTKSIVHLIDIVKVKHSGYYLISIGSDDGFQIWVNGDSLGTVDKGRNLNKDDNFVKVKLHKGNNKILYKVQNRRGVWSLYRKYSKNTVKKINTEVYSDLLETCILNDKTKYINIKDHKYTEQKFQLSTLDKAPIIKIEWLDLIDLNSEFRKIYRTGLPKRLRIPPDFNKGKIFKISVYKGEELLYTEMIPVLSEKFINKQLKRINSEHFDSPIYRSRKNAINIFYNPDSSNKSETREYSTRMKAQTIYNYFRFRQQNQKMSHNFPGPKIMGYISKSDGSLQSYRVYIPVKNNLNTTDQTFPVIIHIPYIRQKSPGFLEYVTGYSNYYMSKLSQLSILFQTIIITPYGRGGANFRGKAKEEIPAILEQVQKYWSINKEKISYLTSSSGIIVTSDLLLSYDFPIKNIYGLAIRPKGMKSKWEMFFDYINNKYPDITFYITNGLEDDIAPIQEVRNWIKIGRKNNINVNYTESKYLGHVLDLDLFEKMLIKNAQINNK